MIGEIIGENTQKGKGKGHKEAIKLIFLVLGLMVLVILLVYGIERLVRTEAQKSPLRIEYGVGMEIVVASKEGSRYHLPWCAGAVAIKEENRMEFSSAQKARQAGFTPAQNCSGI